MSPSTPFRVVGERRKGDDTVFTVAVPDDSPFFEGHFPGQPILPAIGQLAILAELVRRASGSTATLAGVDGLRLGRRVTPGDRVEVTLATGAAGDTIAFRIRCNGEAVSRGTARLAPGAVP